MPLVIKNECYQLLCLWLTAIHDRISTLSAGLGLSVVLVPGSLGLAGGMLPGPGLRGCQQVAALFGRRVGSGLPRLLLGEGHSGRAAVFESAAAQVGKVGGPEFHGGFPEV